MFSNMLSFFRKKVNDLVDNKPEYDVFEDPNNPNTHYYRNNKDQNLNYISVTLAEPSEADVRANLDALLNYVPVITKSQYGSYSFDLVADNPNYINAISKTNVIVDEIYINNRPMALSICNKDNDNRIIGKNANVKKIDYKKNQSNQKNQIIIQNRDNKLALDIQKEIITTSRLKDIIQAAKNVKESTTLKIKYRKIDSSSLNGIFPKIIHETSALSFDEEGGVNYIIESIKNINEAHQLNQRGIAQIIDFRKFSIDKKIKETDAIRYTKAVCKKLEINHALHLRACKTILFERQGLCFALRYGDNCKLTYLDFYLDIDDGFIFNHNDRDDNSSLVFLELKKHFERWKKDDYRNTIFPEELSLNERAPIAINDSLPLIEDSTRLEIKGNGPLTDKGYIPLTIENINTENDIIFKQILSFIDKYKNFFNDQLSYSVEFRNWMRSTERRISYDKAQKNFEESIAIRKLSNKITSAIDTHPDTKTFREAKNIYTEAITQLLTDAEDQKRFENITNFLKKNTEFYKLIENLMKEVEKNESHFLKQEWEEKNSPLQRLNIT